MIANMAVESAGQSTSHSLRLHFIGEVGGGRPPQAEVGRGARGKKEDFQVLKRIKDAPLYSSNVISAVSPRSLVSRSVCPICILEG